MRIPMGLGLFALPVALAPVRAVAQTQTVRPDYWHHGWNWGWGGGHMMFGSLMMVLFWGGLILLIVLAVRRFGGRSPQAPEPQPPGKSALEILEERFARGEIDKDEFEERKRILSA